MKAYERLLKYVVVDTQSDATTETVPSTPGQLDFAKMLLEEVKALGVDDAFIDEYGYLYGHLEANDPSKKDAVGLIAHLDTAENYKGPSTTPTVIKNYDGKAFTLADGTPMDPEKDVHLAEAKGCDIIVTDGTTLLGGDDKAGVAIMMTVLEQLHNNPEIKHGKVCISFTPDEEIGTSQDHFNVESFGADYAYTLDGESAHEISYQNFFGCSAYVTVNGFDFHPGSAKNVMKPAAGIATEYNCMLPQWERPEHTEMYEGFYHLSTIEGNEEKCEMEYLIREFDKEKYEFKKNYMVQIADVINKRYGGEYVTVKLEDSYRNMELVVKDRMEVVENAKVTITEVLGHCEVLPIRGGTDGAELSYKGVPCPNMGTGSYNHHARVEFANVQQMDMLVEVVVKMLSK